MSITVKMPKNSLNLRNESVEINVPEIVKKGTNKVCEFPWKDNKQIFRLTGEYYVRGEDGIDAGDFSYGNYNENGKPFIKMNQRKSFFIRKKPKFSFSLKRAKGKYIIYAHKLEKDALCVFTVKKPV